MKTKQTEPQLFFYKKVVKIPMYSGNFIIIFSNDMDKVAKVVNTRSMPHLYASTFHNFLYGGYESFAVCFNLWGSFPITTGTIVHEVTHCGNRLMESREFYPDWENDEAEAYLKGWMGDQVEFFLKECKLYDTN